MPLDSVCNLTVSGANDQVAFSLTPAKLKEMWIIPLGYVKNLSC
jgi:hypothetical protein